MEWTEDTILRLRELWSEGLSTAEIGRRLGMSKNAVVGKAHRLDLPSRPSPIRRGTGEPRPRRPSVRRTPGPTLPPLESIRRTEVGFRQCWPAGAPAERAAAAAGAATALRPGDYLLLADRRAGHAELPLLRYGVGAG